MALSPFWLGRRVALTGATGFVGHHLAMQLVHAGARVTALVRPSSDTRRLAAVSVTCAVVRLEDPATLTAACRGAEILFHVAGAVDFTGEWERLRRINIDGTRNVLIAARTAGVRRLVFTSSVVAVGAGEEPRPVNEASRWELGRLRVPYVTTKRQAEELILAASGARLETLAVNPTSVIGPDDFGASEFGTLCRRFWRGRIPFYFGGGNNFVDVRDVATGHLLAAERGRPSERYLLGGTDLSYTAFFAALARASGRPCFRLPLPSAVGLAVASVNSRLPHRGRPYLTPGQARLLRLYFFADSGKAAAELGFRPRPLRETVADTHDFWTCRRAG
jgi:dihydroflavonol-4-reductase